MLEVKNLSFFYKKKKHFYLPMLKVPILKQLNFSLELGENLLVYGSSGSGKSTLGKIISGMQSPTQGEVKIDSVRISHILPQKIQYIFQDQKTALNPYRTIKDLIMSVADNFNVTLELDSLLQSFALSPHILSLKVGQLSSGEAQRVGLLRALIPSPKVLVCDEIVSSLDVITKDKILSILKNYQAKHQISYVFISHSKETFRGMYHQSLFLG